MTDIISNVDKSQNDELSKLVKYLKDNNIEYTFSAGNKVSIASYNNIIITFYEDRYRHTNLLRVSAAVFNNSIGPLTSHQAINILNNYEEFQKLRKDTDERINNILNNINNVGV